VVLSFLIVAFGQPYWSAIASVLAAVIGYALFFRALITLDTEKKRFWFATAWMMSVQLVQFSWFLSHPFLYIVAVHLLISFIFGLQFGLIGYFADPEKIKSYSRILLLAGLWTLLEWSRLFVFSGIAFNPVGLSLSANHYTLQTASLWGAFGMSYWVLLTNLVGLKAWLNSSLKTSFLFVILVISPFLYGYLHIKTNEKELPEDVFSALLVQPVFPIEESMTFENGQAFIQFVADEWKQILNLTKDHTDKNIDLVVLPEFIVPFGTYSPVYHYDDVKKTFLDVFGEKALEKLPLIQEPVAMQVPTRTGAQWMVSNAFWLQGLANVLNAPVISGMEDAERLFDGSIEYYSSAQYVQPLTEKEQISEFKRYDKRVLVPMGEYIPFSFCKNLAASYGITGSFTPGKDAVLFDAKVPFGASICYEETFGHLMRENRLRGARLLVNLTSDVWYPTVAQQHCDHSLLRTVENGIPLIRACNTGITGAFDSFGREVKVLGETPHEKIWKPGALYVETPVCCYQTLYSILGDYLIVAISVLGIVWGFIYHKN
jgi:apolipoprotein N-acyltransferase